MSFGVLSYYPKFPVNKSRTVCVLSRGLYRLGAEEYNKHNGRPRHETRTTINTDELNNRAPAQFYNKQIAKAWQDFNLTVRGGLDLSSQSHRSQIYKLPQAETESITARDEKKKRKEGSIVPSVQFMFPSRDTYIEREEGREKKREIEREKGKERETERHRDRERDRNRETERQIERDRETEREREKERNRERQKDRQTDRQTEIDRERKRRATLE